MKYFNVTGTCIPTENYMVDISNRIDKIINMVKMKQYFTINRARQYGKTTTISLLKKKLDEEYICVRMSFEGGGDASFNSDRSFCNYFIKMFGKALEYAMTEKADIEKWNSINVEDFFDLSENITEFCKNKKVVLIIDEVDRASDYHIFLDFLGMLREKFLLRRDGLDYTFHSVILAGVHDVKNIKDKLTREGRYKQGLGEGNFNSPWNIATDFEIDMSFNSDEIAQMLNEYKKDYNMDIDIQSISKMIYDYTDGYPYLVSRICKHIDEKLEKDWTLTGVQYAIKIILNEENTLFDDLFKNLENNENLYSLIYDMLIVGVKKTFSGDSPVIKLGLIYGIIKEKANDGYLMISNKIFEIRICNYFIAKDEEKHTNNKIKGVLQYDIIHDGRFDMELCLRKFAKHYKEVFNPNNEDDIAFLEHHGRLVFLSYLKPLINGQGFYHIESQFTDLRRMDIIIDFGKEQFIIELKRWNGESEHQKAYKQLIGYLESKNANNGYLLTFDFRKGENKVLKEEWIQIGNKYIFDVVV